MTPAVGCTITGRSTANVLALSERFLTLDRPSIRRNGVTTNTNKGIIIYSLSLPGDAQEEPRRSEGDYLHFPFERTVLRKGNARDSIIMSGRAGIGQGGGGGVPHSLSRIGEQVETNPANIPQSFILLLLTFLQFVHFSPHRVHFCPPQLLDESE